MKALVVGGTASTGPPIVGELQDRGYEVAVYHRGVHEVDLPAEVEHIHGNPHFVESIDADLAGRRFDLVVCTYGRIRHLAEALRDRTPRLLTVGGFPVMKGWMAVADPQHMVHDAPVCNPGYEDHVYEDAGVDRFVDRMMETERTVMRAHAEGHYVATHFRYPYVYGPHAVFPWEWQIVKRVLDDRRRHILQDGGQILYTRCASPNAAHAIGLAIDHSDVSGGEIYNVADDLQYTRREWVELIGRIMGYEFEFVDIPRAVAPAGYSYTPDRGPQHHRLLSNSKLKIHFGYRDKVAPEDWIRTTVEHVIAHQPQVDGKGNHFRSSDFDYAAEDGLLAVWDEVMAKMPEAFGRQHHFRHPYPHPKKPGDLL
ncbi:MAG: epimerase [Deltaproteobacteria bacterium]|nr:epimerase [Deltaproteobacteria bacterium]MBW2362667.1 epimerase [Deltaproteobacteria bacterium]